MTTPSGQIIQHIWTRNEVGEEIRHQEEVDTKSWDCQRI